MATKTATKRTSRSKTPKVTDTTEIDAEFDADTDEVEATPATGAKRPARPTRRNRQSNVGTIDFSVSKTAGELAVESAITRGVWVNKLADLRAGVESGQGEYDTFYKIGEFSNPSGARTAIRHIARRPERIPGEFDMEPRMVRLPDGTRVSELWAAVPSDAA